MTLFFTSLVFSHPVIYKDGWVYWATLTSQSNKQRVSYTFHPRFSIEANTEGLVQNSYRDYKIGINILLKRWYLDHSQGNIYLSLHGGTDKKTNYILHPQVEMDWESRKLYTALNMAMTQHWKNNQPPLYKIMYRAGIAPYVAGMKDLQTWFVIQWDFTYLSNEQSIVMTPLLRFFYNNALWEMGASLKGDFFMTLMLHY